MGHCGRGGAEEYGELGNGALQVLPYRPALIDDGAWKSVVAGAQHTVAIMADGSLWIWGANHHGQIGDGTNTHKDTPIQSASY